MELKTTINALPGQQDLVITRAFDLPVELIFKAHTEAELVAQWMGTRVLKFENNNHGGWQFETCDAQGKPVFRANGVFHALVPNQQIIRTFEMENAPFETQLEFLEFEALSQQNSRLTMQIIYRSNAVRDKMLQLPFAQGLNMAHNRLEDCMQLQKKSV